MTLGRRYYVECESRHVVKLLAQGWIVPTLLLRCDRKSPVSDTARQARKGARKLGWTRPAVRFSTVAGTSTAKFDLCPRCSATIREMFGDISHPRIRY